MLRSFDNSVRYLAVLALLWPGFTACGESVEQGMAPTSAVPASTGTEDASSPMAVATDAGSEASGDAAPSAVQSDARPRSMRDATDADGDAADPARGRASLVDHALWERATEADDPFAAERPTDITCDEERGYGPDAFEPHDPDNSSFFVNTLRCDYLTVEQPTLAPIVAGDEVLIQLWQWSLDAPQGATVHLAVAIDEEVLWEVWVPIPSSSGRIREQWIASQDIPEGTPIRFHLHNHGSNEYSLLELSTGPPE